MSKFAFQITGKLSVNGEEINTNGTSFVFVDGKMATSGCTDETIARSIGLDNIVNAVGSEDVLDAVGVDRIADYIAEKGLYEALMAKLMGYSEAA